MIRQLAGLANRELEHTHTADVERIERLLVANRRIMSTLLADVERANGGGDYVVVLQADMPGNPQISVYRRAVVLDQVRDCRPLEQEALEQAPPADSFHVLVGTENVMQVRTVERDTSGARTLTSKGLPS